MTLIIPDLVKTVKNAILTGPWEISRVWAYNPYPIILFTWPGIFWTNVDFLNCDSWSNLSQYELNNLFKRAHHYLNRPFISWQISTNTFDQFLKA